MSVRDFSNLQLMRKPDENSGVELSKLKRIIEQKYKTKFSDFREFHKWTIDHVAEFWAELWDFAGIIHSRSFDEVVDLTVPMSDFPKWFKGARLNYAENLLKFRDNRTAIIAAGEDKETKCITFAEMYEESKLYAAAFRKFGVKKGDVIACYASNRPEPIYAMHATTSIGALWTGALPLSGSQGAISRLQQVSPKILLTVDRFSNAQKEVDMLSKVQEITNHLPSLERVIIIPSKKESKNKDISSIRKSCFLDDFLKLGLEENGTVPEMEFEQVAFSYPVYLNFTSGTTGLPKVMMHGCGALLSAAKDFWLHLDAGRDSVLYSMSAPGWGSWGFSCTVHFCGIGVFLYEGVPHSVSPTSFWDLVDKYKISHLPIHVSLALSLEASGHIPTAKHDLRNVKAIVTGGSLVKHKLYDFFYKSVKKDVLFSSFYGCTEMNGACISVEQSIPVYRGESTVATLGFDVQCVDAKGNPVEGEYGEVVIAKPLPSFLLGLWGDTDGSQAKKYYYQKFPGKFSMGDFAIVNPITKGFLICGRSEHFLNQRNMRFGTSEIYNVVDMIPEVQDSICVLQCNKDGDSRAVLFLKMKEGFHHNQDIKKKIQEAITRELTSSHIPEVILEIPDLPYGISGKKMESVVKNIINKKPFNKDGVLNQECLKNFFDIPELQDF